MLFVSLLILCLGFFSLLKSSEWLVSSLAFIARYLSISEYIIAGLVMSLATTLPEFLVGLSSVINEAPRLSLGNVLGANIAKLSLVLGLAALLSGRINFSQKISASHIWGTFIIISSPIILLLDSELSRLDGLILLGLLVFYLFSLLHSGASASPRLLAKNKNSFRLFIKNIKLFFLAISVLLLSSYLVVESANYLAISLNISKLIVGVFLLGIGTTLPELIFSIRSTLSHHSELSLGNLLGSTALNSTWVLGSVALFSPISLSVGESFEFALIAVSLLLILLLTSVLLRTKSGLNRLEGVILISTYLIFIYLSFNLYV